MDVPKALQRVGIWTKTQYLVRRGGSIKMTAPVILGERCWIDRAIYYQYAVGLAYLLIGLFVYSRRVGAPRSVHFYVLCLASFILSCFHFTGKLNAFDQVIYLGNVAAGILAPTIFLHFCLHFPEHTKWFERRGSALMLYVPGLFLLSIYVLVAKGMLRVAASPIEINWFLDRIWLLYLCVAYLGGALALWLKTPKAEDPLVRQQLKYLRNGAFLGVVPFTVVYAVPYLFGALPGHYQKMAVLSLILVPLTWAYAILRYRLMDVDIIFQQGYVYTLATLVVLGIFYGLIFSFTRPEDLSPAAVVGLIVFATFIFQPIRDWLQEQLDRYFLLQGPLRLPPHADRIRARTGIGNQPGRDASFGGGPVGSHAFHPTRRVLPGRRYGRPVPAAHDHGELAGAERKSASGTGFELPRLAARQAVSFL